MINGWRDTSSTWHSETESYSYDGLDRLTSGSCTSWSHTYSYDKVGNRTSKDSVTYTINSVNEVTALSDGTSFTYDDNGNRTQKTKGSDTWDYSYNYANRLTKIEENSTTIGEYVYDGDGKRLQATENSATTYIYSGYSAIYEENTTGTACYIHGPKGLLAKRTTINQQSDTYYYHTDHLGSVRLATDSSKNIVSAITYQPFGETSTEEGSEHYLFNGKEQDSTGLYYYGARYYDSDVGRFITRDSIKGKCIRPQTFDLYTYCLNNPLGFVDLWGLMVMDDGQSQEEEEEEDPTEHPEITGDPYYENGVITIPTTEGDIEVFNAHKTGSDGVPRGSWGQWKDKAEAKRLRRKAKEYREIAKEYLNKSSSANRAGMLVTAVGGIMCGVFLPAGIAITAYGIGIGLLSDSYLDVAQYYLDEATKLDEHADYIMDSLP